MGDAKAKIIMRFIIQKSEKPGYWVCTDTDNKIVCVFEQGNYNDNQEFTTLEDFNPADFMQMARFAREMGDWLRENHYDKLF
jgi:hypothetical protein